ncbi:MAG: hypothetical protein KAQ62_20975 [Cyclobacteriaceae bacterium]|nr:hypothetical protein [Cyclobacteriaceae bacterium]MCK5371053.1 hypothetical protein [Cyclobacteriaceae bacterium]
MFKNEYPFVSIIKDLFGVNRILFFLLLCLLTFLVLFIKKSFIEYEITAFQILDERGQLGMFKIISALQYLSIPAVYLIKFIFIAFFIWVACFGFGYKVTYSNCWHIVLASEIIFILPELIKVIWFMFFETDPNFATVRAFYPFSMMNFFNFELIENKWHYPLKALNIFEVLYWFLLTAGIYVKSQADYRKSLIIGIFGYIAPFIFWLGYYTIVYK